jgi:hypothetical protein
VRGAREAGDVPDLEPDDHGQHPPDPRQGPGELEFRRRRKHRAQPVLEGEDLPGHEVKLFHEALRRLPAVRRDDGERRLEPLAAAATEQAAGALAPEPGPRPGWHGSDS